MLGVGNGITHKKNQDMLKSRDEFIALAMKENRSHHRCMMLGAIYQECLFLRGEEHPAFLNWCLERMVREGELPSIRALCVKLAYWQCRHDAGRMRDLEGRFNRLVEGGCSVGLVKARSSVMERIHEWDLLNREG